MMKGNSQMENIIDVIDIKQNNLKSKLQDFDNLKLMPLEEKTISK